MTEDANRAAGTIRRVVSGGPHRFRQQHSGVRDARPGHDDLESAGPTRFMAACLTTTRRPGSGREILSLRSRATGISHLPGGSAGGPVYIPKIYDGRNKTFFFVSFETLPGQPVTTRSFNPDCPAGGLALRRFFRNYDAGDRSADASALSGQPNSDQSANATSLVAMQNRFYPSPNFGNTSTLSNSEPPGGRSLNAGKQRYYVIRGDHKFSDSDSIDGALHLAGFRYRRFHECSADSSTWPSHAHEPRRHRHVHSSLFADDRSTKFRWGLATNNLPIYPAGQWSAFRQELGLQGLAPDLPDLPGVLNISFAGLGVDGPSPRIFPEILARPIICKTSRITSASSVDGITCNSA